MIEIQEAALTVARGWQPPTVSEVMAVLTEIETKHGDPAALIGVGSRTVRRWRKGSETTPIDNSMIPYSCWVVLVWLATNQTIIDPVPVDKNDTRVISGMGYCCPASRWSSPNQDELTLFIGKTSFTKLPRTKIAAQFKWSSDNFGKSVAAGNINYVTWCCLMLLVGIAPDFITHK